MRFYEFEGGGSRRGFTNSRGGSRRGFYGSREVLRVRGGGVVGEVLSSRRG